MSKIRSSIIFLMIALYFINYFVMSNILSNFMSLITMVLALITIVDVHNKATRIIGLVLLFSGLFINIFINKTSLLLSIEGIQYNLPLLSLMILAPLLVIPIKGSGLIVIIQEFIDGTKSKPTKTFFGLTGLLAILSPILNIGGVRIVHEFVRNGSFHLSLLARAYFVGFSTAMVWSPYFGSVALVLYYLNVSYSHYFLIGIIFATVQIIIGNLLFFLKVKSEKDVFSTTKTEKSEKTYVKFFLKTVIGLVVLIGSVVGLEQLTHLPMLLLVSFMAIAIPLLWALITRSWKSLFTHLKAYISQLENGMNTEIVLFLSAGLFGNAIATSPFSVAIREGFRQLSNTSFLLVTLIITLIVILLSFVGVHQIVTVPILAMQINPMIIGTSPLVLAFIFIHAWFLASILSSFNAITIFISNAINRSTLYVGFRLNGPYVLVMFFVGMLFINLLHWML